MALAKFISKAALFLRPSSALTRARFSTSAVTQSSKKTEEEEILEMAEEQDEYGLPDELDVSCGMYRKELIARLAGIEDPYSISAVHFNNDDTLGTKINPLRVPSALESRIVACRCEPDSHTLIYMWLHQNEPKRCRCGYWAVLFYREPFVEYMMPY